MSAGLVLFTTGFVLGGVFAGVVLGGQYLGFVMAAQRRRYKE